MEDLILLATFAALAVIALFNNRLDRSPVTLPMVCVLLGAGLHAIDALPTTLVSEDLTILAEVTLAIVLFTDAAHLKLARLNERKSWPLRMLFLGAPLAFGLGTLLFIPLFPNLPVWQVALIAALLVPTDAALGQAVVSNEKIPEHVRDSLTAESGLNDGLLLPLIIFLACAAVGFDHELTEENWWVFAGQQIGFGLGIGAMLGSLGGMASQWSVNKGFSIEDNTAVFALALVALTYFAAEAVGGNSFVAVFTAGLCFGRFAKDCAMRAKTFLETDGVLLIMLIFFFIGALMLPDGLIAAGKSLWPVIGCVTLALFVVRPVAVYLSLLGTKTSPRTRIFFGWFGPRGLATALFTLIVLAEFEDQLEGQTILAVTMVAFTASTFLHGISAHYAYQIFGKHNPDQN